MLEITWVDAFVYLLLAAYVMIEGYGFGSFVTFVNVNAPFICMYFHPLFLNIKKHPKLTSKVVKLPYKIVIDRFMKPFEWKNIYNQRASNCEYILSLSIKQIIPRLNSGTLQSIFLDDRLNKLFYLYRVYTQGFAGLGDTTYLVDQMEDLPGMWIYSKSRGFQMNFDVILFYIQGDAFSTSSPYLYLEFMQRFVVILQEQGFKNPAVFLPKLKENASEVFPKPLMRAYTSWNNLTEKYVGAKTILSGDSTGATTALSLLLLISQDVENVLSVGPLSFTQHKPDAALLISPVTKFNLAPSKSPESVDILTTELIRKWGERYLQATTINSDNVFLRYLGSPGLCDDKGIWTSAFPKYGIILSYGSEEVLAPEIKSFISKLEGIGKMKIDEHNSHIHNWPILNYTSERSVDDREEGLNLFAGMISRMLLWDSESYFEKDAKEPTPILRIDEKFT